MLILNSQNIEDVFDCIVTDIRGRGPVKQELTTTDIPNVDGARTRNGKKPPRTLEVDIQLGAMSQEILRDEIDEINSFIYSEDDQEIRFSDQANKFFLGRCEQSTEGDEVVSTKEMTLVFFCGNQAKHGQDKTFTGTNQVTLDSNDKTPPIMTVAIGESTPSLELLHDETGDELTIHYDLVQGDEVVIDCDYRKVTINGNLQMNSIDFEKADFFKFVKGTNTVTVTPSSSTIDIEFTERWL